MTLPERVHKLARAHIRGLHCIRCWLFDADEILRSRSVARKTGSGGYFGGCCGTAEVFTQQQSVRPCRSQSCSAACVPLQAGSLHSIFSGAIWSAVGPKSNPCLVRSTLASCSCEAANVTHNHMRSWPCNGERKTQPWCRVLQRADP